MTGVVRVFHHDQVLVVQPVSSSHESRPAPSRAPYWAQPPRLEYLTQAVRYFELSVCDFG